MENKDFNEQMCKYEKKNEQLQKELMLTEFVIKLKRDLFAKCTTIQSKDNTYDFDMDSQEVRAQIDKSLNEFLQRP